MKHPFACLSPALLIALVILGSCVLLDTSPLTVSQWSPHDEQLPTLNSAVIRVRFSRPVNVVLTEQAFSITADDAALHGRVSWPDDSTLVFTPDEPLQDFVVYHMSVSRQAEDAQGRDLQPPFSHTFTTRTDNSRPRVASHSPVDHAAITDVLAPLSVTFDKKMDPATVYSSFSLSPSVTGFFSVSPDGMLFTYTPTRQLQWQTHYTLTVSKSAADMQRNTVGSDFTTHFFVGTESVPPALDSVQSADRRIDLAPDKPGGSLTITQGWESTDGLRVAFTETVLTSSALSALTLSPAVPFTVQESNLLYTSTLTWSFPERLQYGTTYTLFAAPGTTDAQGNKTTGQAAYHFVVNGPETRPPKITHVFFPSDFINPSHNQELTAYCQIHLPAPSTSSTETFFDLYIRHSSVSTLDPLVVSQSISITVTNGAADISAFAVQQSPAEIGQAVTSTADVTEEVVRVWVRVTNRASSGEVLIRASTALTDSRGTALAQDFVLPLNDID